MNEQNLKPFRKGDCTGKVEAVRKANESRRKKADLRRMIQSFIDGSYEMQDGQVRSGAELVLDGLIANLLLPGGRNWAKSVDTVLALSGASKDPAEREKLLAEIELLKARKKSLDGDVEATNGVLESLLRLHEEQKNRDAE